MEETRVEETKMMEETGMVSEADARHENEEPGSRFEGSPNPHSSRPPLTDSPLTDSPLTDSPWFWVYLFACVGLILLLVTQSRFAARQAQVERKQQGRIRGAQNTSGRQPNAPMSEEGQTRMNLWPLYGILAAVVVAAWWMLWNRRFRAVGRSRRSREEAAATARTTAPHQKEPVE